MKIKNLKIKNFRNIKDIQITEENISNLNIFTGNNGQGKTNLLEAIYLLSANNSFRTSNYNHLVNHEAEGFNIKAGYTSEERYMEISLNYKRNEKKELIINRKKASKNHPYCPKVVLFTPDDLYLVKGSPAKRRNFIDFVLRQVSAEYAYLLEEYGKILKKRNLLLKKEQAYNKTFSIINQIFTENGAQIIIQRINFINILEKTASKIFEQINESNDKLKIRYALSFPINSDKVNLPILKEKMSEEMEKIKEQEKIRKTTLFGPHLDDINFYYDNRLARSFASQGQQRNIAITLKLAELYTFYEIKGFYPVFLLDEVLSELDYSKKELLIKYLDKADFQTFLTAVNIDHIKFNQASVFYIQNGSVRRKG